MVMPSKEQRSREGVPRSGCPLQVPFSFNYSQSIGKKLAKHEILQAFTFVSSFLYYQDFNVLNEEQKQLYRQGMSAFGGIAPTYHVELLDRPTIVWDFHSLLLEIQMMLSFMLTDEKSSIKVCKHCDKAFIASRPNTVFCSPQCKNQYNVYKSREKNGSDKK